MSKTRASKGTILFWVGGVIACVVAGVWKLVTGHTPKDMDWVFWGLIAVSILVDVEEYLNQIRTNTNEIKEKIDALQEKIEEIESRLDE
jgi:peptidoglycan hydrolase CwlO-like protein